MANVKEAVKVYDLLRNIKALDQPVKLTHKIAPRMALHLAMVVEQGLVSAGPDSLVKKVISDEEQGKIREFTGELLEKAEVGEFYKSIREAPAQ